MNRITRTAAGLLTACFAALTFTALPSMQAAAATELVFSGYRGDINNDMEIDSTDVRLLESYLLGDNLETADEDNPYHLLEADLDDSESLNAIDLTLLKRVALGTDDATPIYIEEQVEDNLIPSPIQAVKPTLPCVGESRVLMFAVNFPDAQHDFTAEEIQTMCFGPENPQSPAYPVESISAYYTRSSYGRLNLTGTVYTYTARHNIDDYAGTGDKAQWTYRDYNDLLDEVLYMMDDYIDYSNFDVNGNGVLDTIILALPKEAVGRDANQDGAYDWWPCSGSASARARYDGMKPGNLCFGAWDLNDITGFNSTWIHEIGHAMGLPDYYKYVNNANDYYGLNGNAGWEMMDDAYGDMSSFSKLMYGWFTEKEVQIYTGGTQTFELQSLQEAPSCILIPRGDLNGFYSEYFMIEFNTRTGNDTAWFSGGNPYQLFWRGGVRILHCNAELWDGWWGPELKWNNYGQMYDDSNQKQRVLRLVKDNADFFRDGAVIDHSTSGFAWYDENGSRTVDPGITITISDYDDNHGCKITIAPAYQ